MCKKFASKAPLRRQAASHVVRQHTLEEGRTTLSSPATAPAQNETHPHTLARLLLHSTSPSARGLRVFHHCTCIPTPPLPRGTRGSCTRVGDSRHRDLDCLPSTPTHPRRQTSTLHPTRCLRAGRLDHPAFLRVYTTHTRAHRDSPKRAPSPMAYSSLVCTPAPRAGGLPPGNQPTSRLHCQARRHSPPPDASTKLCCDVPKEPQPDDDGRNLTLMGSPSRRSAEGRSTERAVPATGSASNTFGAHDGELFQRKMMYGRTRTEPTRQARGDRSLQK
ncbi:hypothetical protein C8Q72DRAFT_322244 [Fomitopsis betulina]|nr:hypothetical protein C8Q72DRAFT_322244 [Fomitopsis betulina]